MWRLWACADNEVYCIDTFIRKNLQPDDKEEEGRCFALVEMMGGWIVFVLKLLSFDH